MIDLSMRAFDEVIVSGISGGGNTYDRLAGVVATVSRENGRPTHIKVWPWDGTTEGGKVWFDLAAVTWLEVTLRDE